MGLGQNVMVFSLILSIFLFLGGVRVIQVSNHDALGAFFNPDAISSGNNPQISSDAYNKLPQSPISTSVQATSGGTGTSFGIVDGLTWYLVSWCLCLIFLVLSWRC